MLEPGSELDLLVALESVAEELHLRRCRPGDHQDTDLLADEADDSDGRVVVQRQLRSGILDPGTELVLADHARDDPECRSFQKPILAEHDALVRQWLPGARVDSLLQDEIRLGITKPAGLNDDG